MKEFKDLVHESHPNGRGTQAKLDFKNGYGVSVVFGADWYSNGVDTYEVAIMKGGSITYSTHITEDVIGYIKSEKVTEIMKKVQELEDA